MEVLIKAMLTSGVKQSTFSTLFDVSLGNDYRDLHKFRTRKISSSAFIDELKQKLQTRMDELDELLFQFDTS